MDAPVGVRLGNRRDGELGRLVGFVSLRLADRGGDRLRVRTVAGAGKRVRFPAPRAASGSLRRDVSERSLFARPRSASARQDARGNVSVNVDPAPGVLLTSSVPFIPAA